MALGNGARVVAGLAEAGPAFAEAQGGPPRLQDEPAQTETGFT